MRAHQRAAAFLLCLLAAGCARLEIYTDPQMKWQNETGFKFYTPKPYVLVGRVAADKPIEISVKYLPDLSKPLYARPRPGWIGSSTLSMTFAESGVLSTFNQTVDTKATEMVTALGGFLTSLATANKTNREARLLDAPPPPDAAKVAQELRSAAAELRTEASDEAVRNQALTRDEADKLKMYAASLDLAASQLESSRVAAPFVALLLKTVSEGIRTQIKPPANEREVARQRIVQTQKRVDLALARLGVTLPAEPFFALYEIVMEGGHTTLVEVKLPEKP